MEKFYFKTLISTFVLAICFQSSFAQVYPIKESITKPVTCLELNGKIPFKKGNPYKVELIYYNTTIDVVVVENKKGFVFNLNKNAYYTIKISREGYLPKLVSIDTHLPESRYNKGFYKFEFSTDLFENNIKSEATEFPITIISYNKTKKEFDYNERYTSNIKAEIKADIKNP